MAAATLALYTQRYRSLESLTMNTRDNPSAHNGSSAPPKILVIDDDKLQIQLIQRILAEAQYEMVGYSDSRQALKEVGSIAPDLVLLDLVMPGIDGFEVCRRLKADEKTRHIPIIFLTAKKDQKTESKVFELGAADYITKPYNPVIVNARILNQLTLKRHRDALERLVHQRTVERDKSQQQFKDLVEKSLVGIAIVQSGKIAYQNPELTGMVPDLADKIVTRDFSFIHPDDQGQLFRAYQGLMDRKAPSVEADIRIIPQGQSFRSNQIKWINCRASAFNYQGGDAILINLVDITHTKGLEQLLLIRNKMASLGRIASGMAHEIRNPLTGITSYLYTMEQMCELKTLLPKDIDLMKQIVSQLKLASHKVDAVIKRVLDFSKPTAPQMMPIDINQCLNTVLHLTAITLRKAGIEVTTALAGALPGCYGDAALIEQVILNLIQNASRAVKTSAGKKQIAVTTHARDNHIHISISDSGSGVPDDLKEKIFDPFFTTSSDGSGIGLSIAQRIITDHYGAITLQTGKLGGAQFTVSLPIEKRKIKR
jgi:signal transduction histidine kinase